MKIQEASVSMKVVRGRYQDFIKDGLNHNQAIAATAEYYGLDSSDIVDELKAFNFDSDTMKESKINIGSKFNADGQTWEIIKISNTEVKAKSLTASTKDNTKTFDIKTVEKNKIKETIEISSEFQIPGTDIILEKGDKIQIKSGFSCT